MTLRSPIVAMLWELWRVTRTEIAWKLALPLGVALAALGLGAAFGPTDDPRAYEDVNDNLAALALILIVLPHLVGWLSVAKLNGGQPGFPFYLAYTRPVRTAVIVGLPMAYLTAMSSAIYLVSAMALRVTSGHAFPLMAVAVWMAALTVVLLAAAWSTRNRSIQAVVGMVAIVRALGLAVDRLTAVEVPDTFDWPPRLWPTLFDWPLTDYAWSALIGLVSVGVTVAMVTRQRRGDALPAVTLPAMTWTPGSGLWQWLINVFRIPCPTSSATRAQLWFDLKSNGLPVLTIGVALAMVIVLVSAVSGPIDAAWNADPDVPCPIGECFWARAFPPLFAPFSLVVMLFLAGNAFGIRRRQGRTYVSAFEATQAYGTGQVAFLKLLVKSVCVLGALGALGVSELPVFAFAAATGARVPITTFSPGSSPERICAETRFITPTRTSRSATLPSAPTTLTSARPPAYWLRASMPEARSPPPLRGALLSLAASLPSAAPVARGLRARPSAAAGRSAASGTSTASFALAMTKNTCAVICVMSAWFGFSTSNKAS